MAQNIWTPGGMTGGSLRDKHGQGAQVQAKNPALTHNQFREKINDLPWYGAMAAELGADLVSPAGMMASDLAMAKDSWGKGNVLESLLYGVSALPFVGALGTGARQAMKNGTVWTGPKSVNEELSANAGKWLSPDSTTKSGFAKDRVAADSIAAPMSKAATRSGLKLNKLQELRMQIQDEYFEKHGYRPQVIFHESNTGGLTRDNFGWSSPSYEVDKAWTGSADGKIKYVGDGVYGHTGTDNWADFGKGDNVYAVISDADATFPKGVSNDLSGQLGEGIAGGDLFNATRVNSQIDPITGGVTSPGGVTGSTGDKLTEYFMDKDYISEIRQLGLRSDYF